MGLCMDFNTPRYTADYTKQFLLPVEFSLKPYNVLSDYSLLRTYCSIKTKIGMKYHSVNGEE